MRLVHFPLSSPLQKSLALVGAGALTLLAASPGMAAEPVAQATATGLVLTVASTPTDSGTYRVTNDGTSEKASGANSPRITALGGQSALQAGTLAQDASTSVVDGAGRSAACAGLAGDGASLVEAGEGFCLSPDDNATINAGTVDLSGLQIVQADLLAGLDQQLQTALAPLLNAVLPAVSDGLAQGLTALGDLDVTLDLGAVQSQCSAVLGSAYGDSQLTDADLSVEVAGTDITLLALPVNPAPNTKVVTDTDQFLEAVVDGLQVQLSTALDGALDPVTPVLQDLQDALNDNILTALSDQLAPIEDNLLDVTLNKQVRPTDDSIEVTALDLRLLPAASQFVDLLDVEIGRSTCGPSGRVAAAPPTDSPSATPSDVPSPAVPTSIPAGEDAATSAATTDGSLNGLLATGAIVLVALLATAGGVVSFRRTLRG